MYIYLSTYIRVSKPALYPNLKSGARRALAAERARGLLSRLWGSAARGPQQLGLANGQGRDG